MATLRMIARLDVKGPNLIKGVQLEGLRVVGDPHEYARKYYLGGIDEILYMDIVASLYNRNSLTDVVRRTVKDIFVPITVGGGIRSLDDAREMLRSGADKVAAWFLDSDYDGRCFCITQAFFPDQDAWKKIAKALGSSADEEAFEKFAGTESLPFKAVKYKRIAVKVINHLGDEVMKVFGVS